MGKNTKPSQASDSPPKNGLNRISRAKSKRLAIAAII